MYYLYYSGHGDVAAEADSSGASTASHDYDPFGAPTDTPPANATSHRYTGAWDKKYDSTNSLILMGARPYDPALGRFLAVDPIQNGALNAYDYAAQDPIDGYDLDGQALEGPSGQPTFTACGPEGRSYCWGLEGDASDPLFSTHNTILAVATAFVPGVGEEVAASRAASVAWNGSRAARGIEVGASRVMLHAPHEVAMRAVDRGSHVGFWHWDVKDAVTGATKTRRHVLRVWMRFPR